MQEHIRVKNIKKNTTRSDVALPARQKQPTHPLLKIQESVGNQALLHLRGKLNSLQAKLSLGQPNDVYEQEADSVARTIVNQISNNDKNSLNQTPPAQMVQKQEDEEYAQFRISEQIRRQPAGEEEEELPVRTRLTENIQRQPEEEEELPVRTRLTENIQRQPEEEEELPVRSRQTDSGSSGIITSDIENQVQTERQVGEALDIATRSKMESGFGYDFSQVNIHNNSASDQIARQLNAEAFTLQGDIFFRNGRYNPDSTQGQDLLAHELTHVVQQGAAPSHDSTNAESI